MYIFSKPYTKGASTKVSLIHSLLNLRLSNAIVSANPSAAGNHYITSRQCTSSPTRDQPYIPSCSKRCWSDWSDLPLCCCSFSNAHNQPIVLLLSPKNWNLSLTKPLLWSGLNEVNAVCIYYIISSLNYPDLAILYTHRWAYQAGVYQGLIHLLVLILKLSPCLRISTYSHGIRSEGATGNHVALQRGQKRKPLWTYYEKSHLP